MSDPRWDADLHTDGVRRTAARALAWSATSQVARQALQFIVFPLLATMLDEDAEGSFMLAVCAWCRQIRGLDRIWMPLESFTVPEGELDITHGLCGTCAEQAVTTAES